MTDFQIGHAVTYRQDTHPDDHGRPLTIVRVLPNNLVECITPARKTVILSTASIERVKKPRPELSFDNTPVALPDFIPEGE